MVRMPPGPDIVRGLDVSHYDERIDFTKVFASGRRFCFAKCTEYRPDVTYTRNQEAARAAGLIFGAYHFFHPSKDPIAQARLFISNAKLQAGDLLPVLDWESTDNIPSSVDRTRALHFMSELSDHYGRSPMIYTSPYFGKALNLDASWQQFPLWIAHYGTSAPLVPGPWKNWAFWQHTETGNVPGIPAPDEDLDIFNGTLETLKRQYVL